MENCPKCGLPVADGAKFCAACGTRMPQKLIKSKVCSVCGNTLNAGAKFCNCLLYTSPSPRDTR